MAGKSRLYVGDLPTRVTREEVEDLFVKYGRLRDIDLKSTDKGPFAFVEFDEERDAGEALRALDARDFQGHRLRVEYSRPPPTRRDPPPAGGAYGRGSDDRYGAPRGYDDRRGGYDDRGRGGYDDRRYDDRGRGGYDDRRYDDRGRGGYDDRRGGYDDRGRGGYDDRRGGYEAPAPRDPPAPRPTIARTNFRVICSGLDRDTAWQDLKDFGREAGQVLYSAVKADRDGQYVGVLEFASEADMRNALRTLDGGRCRGVKVTVAEETADNAFNSRGGGGGSGGARRDRGGYERRERSRSRSRGGEPQRRGYDEGNSGSGGEPTPAHHVSEAAPAGGPDDRYEPPAEGAGATIAVVGGGGGGAPADDYSRGE